jgi:UDP-N-acetylmuramoyl-L-alanyl-D-glutamate--2,6-diaminopimelate ligase
MELSVRLPELFTGIDVRLPPLAEEVDVRALEVDSRKVGPGALFAALKGVVADGAEFAPQAVLRGAAAVLSDRELDVAPAALVLASDARRAFSQAASRFHGEPSKRMRLIGVTGTNGKTTTAYLVEQLAAALGLRTGLIGTVESRWPGGRAGASHTTPESHELQELLARMARAGAQLVSMEVSSHALAQERVSGCTFAAAAFTNLTRDHLDYHGTLEAYFEAKARLFRDLLPRGAPAVLNLDDARCRALAGELPGSIGFTTRGASGARLLARALSSDLEGIRFDLRGGFGEARIESPLIGAHNAENLLAALGLLLGLGMPMERLAAAAAQARGAPGRLERVADPGGRVVLVDYAHTDDALARVLDAVRAAAGSKARVVCVFGCGGDRDRGKRPLMGQAAARRADLVVATSDNPRTEDPLAILADIEPGLSKHKRKMGMSDARAGRDGYCVIPDRAAAIELALRSARAGDAVVIAGKGHEDYQIVGTEKRSFDDRLEARRALEALR